MISLCIRVCCVVLFLLNPKTHENKRYANSCDAIAGYIANARQCAAAVFFRLLHIWHCWRSALGRYFATTMCSSATYECCCSQVSLFHFIHLNLITNQRRRKKKKTKHTYLNRSEKKTCTADI